MTWTRKARTTLCKSKATLRPLKHACLRRRSGSISLFALISLAIGVSGCTSVQTIDGSRTSYSQTSTVGAASVIKCEGEARLQVLAQPDESESTEVQSFSCKGNMVYSRSDGFTGWTTLDAAFAAFLAWITFGGVAL